MKKEILKNILVLGGVYLLVACSQGKSADVITDADTLVQKEDQVSSEPHPFGGWYCPDNLNGFPAVDIADWKNVPVVNGRMPTLEEAQNGTSLIYVDPAEYPNAKVLGITMPKLATYDNANTGREDLIIVIQAFTVDDDSIVGFRFLNGGNGSARLSEVKFLSEDEIAKMPASKFASISLEINASADYIREVMTHIDYYERLKKIVDPNNQFESGWRNMTNVNYHYAQSGAVKARYADVLFGNFYIQNDYTEFTEKFMLLENGETKTTELKIVCGPFKADFESQKAILNDWAQKVKELSE
ncbi:MAG: hypothetical protein IPG07_02435 [Crocinitomicaceae bacterium]|nr:hypothetical protein [Crocinitomicaceae bacterium]